MKRDRMSMEDRAKQFLPFSPLKGYSEALRAKEVVEVPHSALSEDEKQILDRKLSGLQLNDLISVTYYKNGKYISVSGILSRIDVTGRWLKIVQTVIPLDDIVQLDLN